MKWTSERVKNSTGPGEDALLLEKGLAHMWLQAWWDRKAGWSWQLMASDKGTEVSPLRPLPGMTPWMGKPADFPSKTAILKAQEAAAREAIKFLHRQIEELLPWP